MVAKCVCTQIPAQALLICNKMNAKQTILLLEVYNYNNIDYST